MNPAFTDNADLYSARHQGPFNAIIHKTYIGESVADQAQYAPANQVSYDIIVNFPSGPVIYKRQVPHHRRAVIGADIEPAQPNDECVACLRGNLVRFFVVEGIPTGDCA